jgi:hypothetical protein
MKITLKLRKEDLTSKKRKRDTENLSTNENDNDRSNPSQDTQPYVSKYDVRPPGYSSNLSTSIPRSQLSNPIFPEESEIPRYSNPIFPREGETIHNSNLIPEAIQDRNTINTSSNIEETSTVPVVSQSVTIPTSKPEPEPFVSNFRPSQFTQRGGNYFVDTKPRNAYEESLVTYTKRDVYAYSKEYFPLLKKDYHYEGKSLAEVNMNISGTNIQTIAEYSLKKYTHDFKEYSNLQYKEIASLADSLNMKQTAKAKFIETVTKLYDNYFMKKHISENSMDMNLKLNSDLINSSHDMRIFNEAIQQTKDKVLRYPNETKLMDSRFVEAFRDRTIGYNNTMTTRGKIYVPSDALDEMRKDEDKYPWLKEVIPGDLIVEKIKKKQKVYKLQEENKDTNTNSTTTGSNTTITTTTSSNTSTTQPESPILKAVLESKKSDKGDKQPPYPNPSAFEFERIPKFEIYTNIFIEIPSISIVLRIIILFVICVYSYSTFFLFVDKIYIKLKNLINKFIKKIFKWL